ncbi:MAG TPA: hypothetical protein DCG06_00330, partial [Deltaproteobacteria bacterium]|nr:hypothetical protein [Deltaproteobacteria bacterium]
MNEASERTQPPSAKSFSNWKNSRADLANEVVLRENLVLHYDLNIRGTSHQAAKFLARGPKVFSLAVGVE